MVGLLVNQLNDIQSVFNAATRSIAGLRRPNHIDHRLCCQFSLATSKLKLVVLVPVLVPSICSATSLICRRKVDFTRLLSDFLMPALHDSSLLVMAHVLQPDYDSGIAYLKSFSLPRRQSHYDSIPFCPSTSSYS